MPRILVVDDEENFRKLYSMELSSEGYDVSLADS
ncbi:MAG TPA: response regulator, partial [candidate division Zixibacteria bacterium]|nr:response regulator [candidate division Zixibacteria bacterium]